MNKNEGRITSITHEYGDGSRDEFVLKEAQAIPKEPTFELVTGAKGDPNAYKHRSFVRDRETGLMHGAGYNCDEMITFDPESGKSSYRKEVFLRGSQSYVDGLQAPDGRMWFSPHKGPGVLVFDPKTNESKLIGRAIQARGLALDDEGILHFSEFSGHKVGRIFRVDTKTDTWLSALSFTPDRTGALYSKITDWQSINGNGILDGVWGLAKAGNGKLVSAPFGGDRGLIIDHSTGEVTQSNEELNGGGNIPEEGSRVHSQEDDYWAKYSGATTSSKTGDVFFFPRRAKTICVYLSKPERFIEIPLPYEVAAGKGTRSFSSVEGPDGNIWSVVNGLPFVFWINPVTFEIKSHNISGLMEGLGNPGFTYGASNEDSIYCVAGLGKHHLKITP